MVESEAVHRLQNKWVFWEQKVADQKDYDRALNPMCEFDSIESFWSHWPFIPRPSEAFNDGSSNKKQVEGRMIKAFGVFKKGIEPRWEDPANIKGSELVVSKSFNLEALNLYWENLVFGLIGETVDEEDQICGSRVVDQSRKGKIAYKIEIWLKSTDDEIANKVKMKLAKVIDDGINAPDGSPSHNRSIDFEFNKRGND